MKKDPMGRSKVRLVMHREVALLKVKDVVDILQGDPTMGDVRRAAYALTEARNALEPYMVIPAHWDELARKIEATQGVR